MEWYILNGRKSIISFQENENSLLNLGDSFCIKTYVDSLQEKKADKVEIDNWPYKDSLTINQLEYIPNSPNPDISPNIDICFSFSKLTTHGKDLDSIIYFFKQYDVKNVVILDDKQLTFELSGKYNVESISIQNIISYWRNFDEIVYIDNDYETGLIASSYASLLNVPIIIKNSILDNSELYRDKNIICIGNVNPDSDQCDSRYSIEQLQLRYKELTNTDKIILINTNDQNIGLDETYNPSGNSGTITEIFSGTSLSAPVLASAKHEIIISKKFNYIEKPEIDALQYPKNKDQLDKRIDDIDSFIENRIQTLGIRDGFLTILASPDAIDNLYYEPNLHGGSIAIRNADVAKYASIDKDSLLELAVGRIYGITISDVSSYIARSVFYNEIKNGDEIYILAADLFSGIEESYGYMKLYNQYNIPYQSEIELDDISPHPESDEFINKKIIQYKDHGTSIWLGITSNEIPDLDNTFFLASAGCKTCIFYSHRKSDLFCTMALRKGAIGYIGMFIEGGPYINYQLILSALSNDLTVGEAWQGEALSNIIPGYDSEKSGYLTGNGLLGDPTLKINMPHKLPFSSIDKVQEDQYIVRLKLAKIPVQFRLKQKDVKSYSHILSPVSMEDDIFINAYREGGLAWSRLILHGLIKLGPFPKKIFNNVEIKDEKLTGRIILHEPIDENEEYLWIWIESVSDDFYYDIDETNNDFGDYEISVSLS